MIRLTTLRRRVAVAAVLLGCIATPAFLHAADLVFHGRIYGGRIVSHSVYVGTSDRYVTVRGDGDTDLDCWIYDSQNQLVDSDTDSTDYCILATPGVGTHRLVIKNLGNVYNEYVVSRE